MRRMVIWATLGLLAGGCGPVREPPEPGPVAETPARLVRIGYLVGEIYQYLDVDSSLPGYAELVRAPSKPKSTSVLTYEAIVGAGQENVLILDDGAPSSERPPGAKQLSHALHGFLRGLALNALRASMKPPRRVLDWHALALAKCLELGEYQPYFVGKDDFAWLTTKLDESPNLTPVAAAVYQLVPWTEEGLTRRFATDDRIALRLVPLVRAARLGDRLALAEIFRLSLEYHSALPVFAAAAQALFPGTLNQQLYRERPPGLDGPACAEFLNAIGTRLRDARHDEGLRAWSLREVTGPSSEQKP